MADENGQLSFNKKKKRELVEHFNMLSTRYDVFASRTLRFLERLGQ